jgi:tetratricopeptide (TPR) repeat protein
MTLAFTLDKRKTLEAATKHAQRGAFDKALKEYQKLLKADPQDSHVRLRIGDLYLRKGEPSRAIDSYEQVASQLAQKGFDAKAAAIYKQILRINPDRVEARVRLGELHQRQGLASDALREFEKAAEQYRQRGDRNRAFDLLRRLASLDPTNFTNRLGLGDLLFREGMVEEAAEEYKSLLRDVQAEDQPEELARVAERMLACLPEDPDVLQAYAIAKVQCGEAQEALERLSKILDQHPECLGAREALVQVFEGTGDSNAAQSLYREMAELYKERGNMERSREILQRYASPDPLSNGPDDTPTSIELTEEVFEHGNDLGLDEGLEAETQGGSEPALDLSTASLLDATPEDLSAEAKVALEFGDLDDAESRARRALEAEPTSDEPRAVLAEVLARKGNLRDAISYTEERRDLAASAAEGDLLSEVEDKLREYQGEMSGGGSARGGLPDIEIELVDESDQDSRAASVEPPASLRQDVTGRHRREEVDIEQIDLDPNRSQRPEPQNDLVEDLSEADFYAEQGMLDEAGRVLESVLERSPDNPQVLSRLNRLRKERSESGRGRRRSRQPEPTQPSGPSIDVDLDLDLQEDPDDPTPRSVAIELDEERSHSRVPTPPEHHGMTLEMDLGEEEEPTPGLAPVPLEADSTMAPTPRESRNQGEVVAFELDLDDDDDLTDTLAASGGEENPFDLAAELEAAIPDDATDGSTVSIARTAGGLGFQQVLSAFKSAIEEQIGEKESQAHYDLGIAYREMGLVEDAVREFELASRGDGLRLEALPLLGACKVEAGRPHEALGDLEEAMKIVPPGSEAELALRYERAQALAACGERDLALEEYRCVHRQAPDFRDVSERIEEIANS